MITLLETIYHLTIQKVDQLAIKGINILLFPYASWDELHR